MPTLTCDPKSKTIQKGAKGEKVIELQTDLTRLGYAKLLGKHGPKQVGIDGIFGDDTKKAVIKFQQDQHLKKIDGIVGPETWGAICSSLSAVIPSNEIKENLGAVHQIEFVPPRDGIQQKLETIYRQAVLEEETSSVAQPHTTSNSSEEPEENETDFPVGDFQSLGNLTQAELGQLATDAMTPPENVSQLVSGVNETVPGEQLPPTNETVPPENVSQLVSGVNETVPGEQLPPTNETVPPENVSQLVSGVNETVPGEQLPPTNETVPPENVSQLVSGVNETVPGEQLPPTNETVPPENVSQLPTGSPSPTTSGAEPLCSDGLPPDANGLCADGLPPTAVNVTASPDVASSYTLVP